MFRKLLLIACCFTAFGFAQANAPGSTGGASPDCYTSSISPVSATGTGSQFNNVKSACTTWILFYQTSSNVNSLSIQIESASAGSGTMNPGSFAVFGEASTTAGSGQITSLGNPGWVQINITTLGTSSGTAFVSWVLLGWRSLGPSSMSGYGSGTAGGTNYQLTTCDQFAAVTVTAGNTTQLIALTTSRSIRVCAFAISISATGTANFSYGSGSNCVTGNTPFGTPLAILANTTVAHGSGVGELFKTPISKALCLGAVTGNVTGFVSYAVY